MKTILLAATLLLCFAMNAAAQAKVLTNDPLTALPLIPASVMLKNAGNEPVHMPDGQICKSKMQGNFYSLYNYFAPNNVDLTEAITWYSSHLSGFKRVGDSGSSRASQIAFYNSDGTIVVILTGEGSEKHPSTKTYSVAYERYQPGLSEKTIASLTREKIVCQ
jgi:hypothetical protein